MGSDASTANGRRARNMRDKHDRIFRAASDLFAERGFESVSTGQVSDRADVAAGTVFRYASTKGELLLMVLNEELRTALDVGATRAATTTDTAEAVYRMVLPLLEYAQANPENGNAYHRELLFGGSGDHYRAEGLALVAELQDRIAERLVADADGVVEPDRAMLTANMIFAVTALAIARASTGAHSERDSFDDVRTQVHIAVDGYTA
ncbi:TetR/AcrR family transcriptional regulator [Gordonia aichiensis]|uniref:Putative TetR family transcriptional regulator n=1 Tax=Gordonia aichiensis NBRC 108223 TaxID=1220583 RepID=L7KN79_9ACTN|nr:TetR/AcrR family transcriptional regulator [Gordonia aichiensis]GAC50064.1 putative TetR family transcriptional regulator [Gordonia aichiensis NBRC 108223]